MFKNVPLCTILFLFAGYTVFGQQTAESELYDSLRHKSNVRSRSELSLYFGGGQSALNYKPDVGAHMSEIGGIVGVSYSWFMTKRWGVVTGFEVALFRAEYIADEYYSGSYSATSGSSLQSLGDDFIFSFEYQDLKEKQSVIFMQIPVMTKFQTKHFFASAGIKIGIPAEAKFEVTATELNTAGYFPYENQTYYEPVELGFGVYGPVSYSANLDINFLFSAAFEAGGQIYLGNRTKLSAGFWLDYGLNDLNRAIKKPIVEYDLTVSGNLKCNSVFHKIDRISTISAGLMLRIIHIF